MLPKQKADNIIHKYEDILKPLIDDKSVNRLSFYRPCAMITINELISYHEALSNYFLKVYRLDNELHNNIMKPVKQYLKQLKKEIKNYEN